MVTTQPVRFVKAWLLLNGKKVDWLAKRVKRHRVVVSRAINGTNGRSISDDLAERIARVIGEPVEKVKANPEVQIHVTV